MMLKSAVIGLISFCTFQICFAQNPKPAIEYSSLLDAVNIKFLGQELKGDGGQLVFNQRNALRAVFLPKPDRWIADQPDRSGGHELRMKLFREGSDQALVSYGCNAQKISGTVFSKIDIPKGSRGYKITEAGKYLIRFELDGQSITQLNFSVEHRTRNDAFDTKVYAFLEGEWSHMAYLEAMIDRPGVPLTFKTWTRKIAYTSSPDRDKIDVTLLRGKEVVAVTAQRVVAWPQWQTHSSEFRFPNDQGGSIFQMSDLVRHDGRYTIQVQINKKLVQVFQFDVKKKQLVPMNRQATDYEPHTAWLCPRNMRSGSNQMANVYWLQSAGTSDSNPDKSN